jgi:hypothetical protein
MITNYVSSVTATAQLESPITEPLRQAQFMTVTRIKFVCAKIA